MLGLGGDLSIFSFFLVHTFFSPRPEHVRTRISFLSPIQLRGLRGYLFVFASTTLLLLVPASMSWFWGNARVGPVVLALTWLLVQGIYTWFYVRRDDFPAPLVTSNREGTFTSIWKLAVLAISICAITDVLLPSITRSWGESDKRVIEGAVYLTALYWLLSIAAQLPGKLRKLGWLAELEGEVFLGTTSVDEAVTKLKVREFGAEVGEIFAAHVQRLSDATTELLSAYESLEGRTRDVRSIPEAYGHERAARMKQINDDLDKKFSHWQRVATGHLNFLKQLVSLNIGRPELRPFITSQLDELRTQLARTQERNSTARRTLDA